MAYDYLTEQKNKFNAEAILLFYNQQKCFRYKWWNGVCRRIVGIKYSGNSVKTTWTYVPKFAVHLETENWIFRRKDR
jgi:hypothetical protein